MVIEIVGKASGSERDAAEALVKMLRPRLNQASRLLIVVGAKCIGFPIQDIDLLILGTFGSGLKIGSFSTDTVTLVNLALVIEVKDHSGDRVAISSQHVAVQYGHSWENATEQAFKQAKV